MKIIDLCCCDRNEAVYNVNARQFFADTEYGNWRGYYNSLVEGSRDTIEFEFDEIDRRVFIIDDGGEIVRLRDGRYFEICWRFGECAIWLVDDFEKEIDLNELRRS